MSQIKSSSFLALYSDSHKQSILGKFDKLRKRDLLCDVTVVVENVHFKAHKALLAASSEFFSNMFTTEDQKSTCQLDGMAAKMFAAVLEFIYSAQVSVEESAMEQLLAAAHLTEVSELVKVLTELTSSTAAVKPDNIKADRAEGADLTKRKRGRPKKSAGAHGESSVDKHAEDKETRSTHSKDHDSEAEQRHLSKRKIRTPVKFKGYKIDCETGSKESGRSASRRKYPNTEARCEDCEKVFKHHLFLKIHQRTHTGEKPFLCLVCGKKFTQKHTLLAHQRIHTGEKPFVCSICSKALSTKHSLQEHMTLHEVGLLFDCDKCGKTFNQKKQLKSHYRVHTGQSLPECAQCHHRFMDAAQLKKHLRTHTGKKPFTCSFCSLSFTRLDNLRTHNKSHNKEFAASAETSAGAPQEETSDVIQLQPFQPALGSEQEIQMVVTEGVDDINFVTSQDQEISLITTDGEAAQSAHSRFTLLTQPSVQNLALVTQGDVVAQSPQIHPVSMLESNQPEQMHVITLSKEAMEHLQAHHGPAHSLQITRPIQQLQVMHQPLQQLAVAQENSPGLVSRDPHSQAIHISSQSSQPISISHTSEQISNHHIQGQTFQIQAGTVSYLYTTGLPQDG
uniref:Zinc finger and BTB domain containing 24 n=1 Tax=Nothobranchius kadleci TaxID=1051664 RepID=A0A1A8BSD0_NOTKA